MAVRKNLPNTFPPKAAEAPTLTADPKGPGGGGMGNEDTSVEGTAVPVPTPPPPAAGGKGDFAAAAPSVDGDTSSAVRWSS